MIYAGIGSRETPKEICEIMELLACGWGANGYTLRSGGAKGADLAFENGCGTYWPKEIFKAKDVTPEAIEHASQYHPNWGACRPYARKLHGRNSMIILGASLNAPVDFVCCWTENGLLKGGTAQGIRVAIDYDIPVYNLGDSDMYDVSELSSPIIVS